MGLFPKAAEFLGIDKFGKGIAATGRFLSGHVGEDFQHQEQANAGLQKLVYAAKQEQDPEKKRRLLEMANRIGTTTALDTNKIDPNLSLTNKEVIGSAINTGLNITAGGSLKTGLSSGRLALGEGAKLAKPVLEATTNLGKLAKGTAIGAAYGLGGGLEKNRDASGVAGSTVGGALLGAGTEVVGMAAKAAKDFLGNKVPTWMMNKAVKPALQDLKKNVKYGTKTLGEELLNEGVKGGPKKLLEIADTKQTQLEGQLQNILNDPNLAEAGISRKSIYPYVKELSAQKAKVPGSKNDLIKINEVLNDLPQKMNLQQANEIKRAIYQELRNPAYKLDARLSVKADTLKQVARGLKTEIENTVGGTVVKDINNKLSIYGRLENSMVDQLARNLRHNGVGLTDAILLGGGPTTSILALLRHLGQGTETYAAQGLHQVDKIGTGVVGKTVKGVAKRAVLNVP